MAVTRPPRLEIIGHRGASADAPENTLESVRLAWEQGADGAEIDLHVTADGEVVSIHDDNVKRYTGRDAAVAGLTWAELSTMDFGAWKDPKWAGVRPSKLAPILSAIPSGKHMFLELKTDPSVTGRIAPILRSLSLSPAMVDFIVWERAHVEAVRRDLPGHRVLHLVEFQKTAGGWEPDPSRFLDEVLAEGADGIDTNTDGPFDETFRRRVRAAGLAWYVWTLNDERRLAEMAGLGVWGVTTDRPGFMAQARDRMAPRVTSGGRGES